MDEIGKNLVFMGFRPTRLFPVAAANTAVNVRIYSLLSDERKVYKLTSGKKESLSGCRVKLLIQNGQILSGQQATKFKPLFSGSVISLNRSEVSRGSSKPHPLF